MLVRWLRLLHIEDAAVFLRASVVDFFGLCNGLLAKRLIKSRIFDLCLGMQGHVGVTQGIGLVVPLI